MDRGYYFFLVNNEIRNGWITWQVHVYIQFSRNFELFSKVVIVLYILSSIPIPVQLGLNFVWSVLLIIVLLIDLCNIISLLI